MEDKVTYEDIVKCRKMLTDRVLAYRELAHKIRGATFAIIGGMFLLVGIFASKSLVSIVIGMLVASAA